MSNSLLINVWDVGHGLSVYMRMPKNHIHIIDLGNTEDFSPCDHIHIYYHVDKIDHLIISHPDQDHLSDIQNLITNFGNPRVLLRNKTLPDEIAYGSLEFDYQKLYKKLDQNHRFKCDWSINPQNPQFNGGVEILTLANDYSENDITANNTSVVTFVSYFEFLFICPGDIEPKGWDALCSKYYDPINQIINTANQRILVAPHHGRKSGYSDNMMKIIKPHAVIISDIWGDSETHPNYYNNPLGLHFDVGNTEKYYSTKRGGRIRIEISDQFRDVEQY